MSVTTPIASSTRQAALDILNTDLPLGAWAATAQATSKAPTLIDIRKSSVVDSEGQLQRQLSLQRSRSGSGGGVLPRRQSLLRSGTAGLPGMPKVVESREVDEKRAEQQASPAVYEEQVWSEKEKIQPAVRAATSSDTTGDVPRAEPSKEHHQYDPSELQRRFSSGYIPPAKIPWATATWIGFKGFIRWFITPAGFLITIYCLNIVAWGGMLFLLLCGAAPAMCWVEVGGIWMKSCNHIQSPRRIWLEIDSQILNALFCVTGFGLIPWRFRDLYYLVRWRLCSEKKHGKLDKMHGLRVLAGTYNAWFRLPGHDTLDIMSNAEYHAGLPQAEHELRSHIQSDNNFDNESAVDAATDTRIPLPIRKAPSPPVTGIRAPPTVPWKLDFFIWCNVWNTFFQACLCGFMWGMNRYNRPSWSTGLFIALACGVAGVGGVVSFIEGKRVKRVEGVVVVAA